MSQQEQIGFLVYRPESYSATPHLEVGAELGRGGYATVHLAADRERGGQRVAAKIFREPDSPAFETEREAAEWDPHDRLLTPQTAYVGRLAVWDAGQRLYVNSGDRPVLTSEYTPLGTMADWAKSGRKTSAASWVKLTTDVATGLDHLHHRTGKTHADVKPENIFLFEGPDKGARLGDFGTAVEYYDGHQGRGRFLGTTVIGSPGYMPLEQLYNEPVGQTDIWALAATLYKSLTGRLPFPDSAPEDYRALFEAGAPPVSFDRIHELTRSPQLDALEPVLYAALQHAPKKRQPDVGTFAEELKTALAQGEAEAAKARVYATSSTPKPQYSDFPHTGEQRSLPSRSQPRNPLGHFAMSGGLAESA